MKEVHQVHSKDYTLSVGAANLLSILAVIPVMSIYFLSYGFLWGWKKFGSDMTIFYDYYIMAIVILVAGIVLHELLHAIVWALAGSLSLRVFKFGFNLSGLAPYAHCQVPMPARAYRRGTAAPGVLLGIIPFCLALVTGNAFLMSFGFIFTLAAGGDFLMLWLVRNVEPDVLVQDHSTRIGCEIVPAAS